MSVRDTSLAAIADMNQSGRAGTLRATIYGVIAMNPSGITRKAIADRSGLPINTVAGRVNELLKVGMVAELPAIKDEVTGRYAHPLTAEVRVERCKNCDAIIYVAKQSEPLVLGYLCSDQCERENAEHYE